MKKYFYTNGKEQFGTFSLEELKDKNITQETLIWFKGLDNWTKAKYIHELKPILELIPPPIESVDATPPPIVKAENKKDTTNIQNKVKEASNFWIAVGFIFCFLGGLIGIAMGFNYARGNYKKEIKELGWGMVVIGFISLLVICTLKNNNY